MPSNCGDGEDSQESLGQQGDQTSQSSGKSTLNTHWKDWCWSWSSSILVIWCVQRAHWKSPWCWERLRAEGKKGVRGWDGWMASLIQWTWTWANFGRWWGTGRPSVLGVQCIGLQRVGHDWWLNNNNNERSTSLLGCSKNYKRSTWILQAKYLALGIYLMLVSATVSDFCIVADYSNIF